jgi:hypothetical protein
MTAGPIERALRFLNITSVNCGAPEEGGGVTEADNAGVVLAGEATAGELAFVGEGGGVSSCANDIDASNRPETTKNRVVIGWERNDGDLRWKGKRIAAFAPLKTRVLSTL